MQFTVTGPVCQAAALTVVLCAMPLHAEELSSPADLSNAILPMDELMAIETMGNEMEAQISEHMGANPEREHQLALDLAEQGQYEDAIRSLLALADAYPDRPVYRFDAIVVMGWAEMDNRVLRYYNDLDPVTTPVYVLETLARALRNHKRYIEAETLYRLILQRDPTRLPAHEGLILTMTDQQLYVQALKHLERTPFSGRDYYPLRCYIQRQQGSIHWLDCALRWQAQQADNPEASRQLNLASQALGAWAPALQLTGDQPQNLQRIEILQLLLDDIAEKLRWLANGILPPGYNAKQLESRLHSIMTDTHNKSALQTAHQRARADLIFLYTLQQQHEQGLALANEYQQQAQLPAYLLAPLGESALALKRYSLAESLFQQSLKQERNNVPAQDGLYATLVAQNKFEPARELLQRMNQQTPAWQAIPARDQVRPNYRKTDLLVRQAMLYAYEGRHDNAQRRIQLLANNAPANATLLNELSLLQRWQGEYTQACRSAATAYTLAPDDGTALQQLYYCQHEQWQFKQADQTLNRLRHQQNAQTSTTALLRHQRLERKARWYSGYYARTSQTNQSNNADRQWYASLLGNRFADYWRGTLDYRGASLKLNQQTIRLNNYRLGINMQRNRLESRAQLSISDLPASRYGVFLSQLWRAHDRLQLQASVDTDPAELPLLARNSNISGTYYQTLVDFRASARLNIQGGFGQGFLSDGNRQTRFQSVANYQLPPRGRHQLELNGGLYRSSNKLTETAYYSPASSLSIESDLNYRLQILTTTPHKLDLQLSAGTGLSGQQTYPFTSTWQTGARLNWHYHDLLSISAETGFMTPVYDGQHENTWQTGLYLSGRLP